MELGIQHADEQRVAVYLLGWGVINFYADGRMTIRPSDVSEYDSVYNWEQADALRFGEIILLATNMARSHFSTLPTPAPYWI